MARIDTGENTMETGRSAATPRPGVTTVGEFLAMMQTYSPRPLPGPQRIQPSMVSFNDSITSVMPSIRDCWVAARDIASLVDSEATEDSAGSFAALLAHCFAHYLEGRNVSPDQADRLQRLIDNGAECVAPGTMLDELRAGTPQIAKLAADFQVPRREHRGLAGTCLVGRRPGEANVVIEAFPR